MIRLISPILSLYFGTYRKFRPIQPHSVKKIAICPAGGIGDCITILPMIRLLKRICLQAEIHIIANERNYSVLENDTDIQEIHIPKTDDDWVRYRKYNFSVVFILNWINISAWGIRAWKIGGRNSIRIIPFQGKRYNHFFSYQYGSTQIARNVTDIYIDLVADTFGIEITKKERANIPYRFELGNDADEYAHTVTSLFGNGKYAIINYSIIHERKRWHDEGYRTIAENILEQFPDMYIVIIYVQQDEEKVRDCFEILNSNRIIYALPHENFLYSVALIRNSQFLFSVDTSFIHCCSAFGIPVFGLYIGEKNNSTLWSARNVPFLYIESKNGQNISSIQIDEVLPPFRKFLDDRRNT